MRIRSTNVLGNPYSIDDGVTYLRQNVMPTLEKIDGCIGLSMLADRESGRCITATAWQSDEAMRAAAEQLEPTDDALALTLGGEHPTVQGWDVALLHREHRAGDGAGAQVAWARIQFTHLDDLIAAYRDNLMPQLQQLPGFCSASVMVDRRGGRTVSVTCFEEPHLLDHVRKQARFLREQFAQAMGARVVDIAETELALAHLRVPETV